MILVLHVVIALTSLLFSSFLLFKPTKNNFTISYILVALTIISGTFLVVVEPAHMLQACVSGLVYTSLVLVANVLARRKEVTLKVSDK